MTENEKKTFIGALVAVADYYGRELSPVVINVYWQGLKGYDLVAVQSALGAHARNPDTGQFMPKIADIAKMLEGRTEDQAQLAWTKVDAAVRQVGPWEDVAFDDPLIHRVVADMGGWVRMCSSDDKEYPFVGKEFITRYRGYRSNGARPDYPRYLLGTANASNSYEGKQRMPVRLFGDPGIARQVIQGGVNSLSYSQDQPRRLAGGAV